MLFRYIDGLFVMICWHLSFIVCQYCPKNIIYDNYSDNTLFIEFGLGWRTTTIFIDIYLYWIEFHFWNVVLQMVKNNQQKNKKKFSKDALYNIFWELFYYNSQRGWHNKDGMVLTPLSAILYNVRTVGLQIKIKWIEHQHEIKFQNI